MTILAVVGIMTVMALFGMAVANLIAKGDAMRSDHALYETASMVTQAGIEYGVKKIYEGQSPVVAEPGINFGRGNFIIVQSGRTLTITSRVGEVSVVRRMDSPTEADCTRIDVSSVNVVGDNERLSGIQIRKVCLAQVVIDRVTFAWTPDDGEELTKIKIENATVYNNPAGDPSGTLLDITNYVMNNNNQNNMNHVEFNDEIEDKTFTMTLIFGDGTTLTVTFTPDD